MRLVITKSDNPAKKWKAVFTDGDKHKTIHFGSSPYQDYTQHHSKERRTRYLTRHKDKENWNTAITAGSLSRWLLWGNSTSFQENLSAFKRRFHLL
tara:strand:- start:817 stop:1104 length:288 start_codon:yes stop_codon:yes gene_type:complete